MPVKIVKTRTRAVPDKHRYLGYFILNAGHSTAGAKISISR